MRVVDFSKPGGLPLTQDVLGYMQAAYSEAISALAGARGPGPYVLSGCVYTDDGSTQALTDGWLFYNNEVYRAAGGSIAHGAAAGFTLAVNNTSLVYNNGAVNSIARQEQYMQYGIVPDAASNSTRFPLGALQPYAEELAVQVPNANGNAVTGNIKFKKNWQNNTLHMYGSIEVNGSLLPGGSLPVYIDFNVLPAGYIPAAKVPFTAYINYNGHQINDDQGYPLRQINGEIRTDGTFSLGYIKTAAGTTFYSAYVNCIIPLS